MNIHNINRTSRDYSECFSMYYKQMKQGEGFNKTHEVFLKNGNIISITAHSLEFVDMKIGNSTQTVLAFYDSQNNNIGTFKENEAIGWRIV